MRETQTVAVLGSGLQGCAVALELACRGWSVVLFEAQPTLFSGVSQHNEGKIHLGFVYAADPSLRSARVMMRGAATFQPLLRTWVGDALDEVAVSRPFNYAVHRDSQYDATTLAGLYAQMSGLIHDQIPADACYLGTGDPAMVRRLEDGEFDAYDEVEAVFETSEIAVNCVDLACVLVRAVQSNPNISVLTSTRVTAVDPTRRRLTVETNRESRITETFDHIVNCAWGGRPSIDATVGILPRRQWSFRMKYFVRLDIGADDLVLPSTTIVLGSFGDIVDFGGGKYYFSWYPAGRRGWSTKLEPPAWAPKLSGDDAVCDLAVDTLSGLATVVPAVGMLATSHTTLGSVCGGIIYALGDTDISDPDSGLHMRVEVGPYSEGSYHTIDTGKLTLAPMFAAEVADRIEEMGRG